MKISVKGGKVYLNDSTQVTKTDVLAPNGVIHVINTVLLPPGRLERRPPLHEATRGASDAATGGTPRRRPYLRAMPATRTQTLAGLQAPQIPVFRS